MVDASDEDLPVEWEKRQKKNGSFYYRNAMTGAVQDSSPHEGIADATGGADTRARRGVARIFQVRIGETKKEVGGRVFATRAVNTLSRRAFGAVNVRSG